MTAHVNLPLGTPVTIAYYPPENLDPATYGREAAAELQRSDLSGQGIEAMERAVRGVQQHSTGETQRGFSASFSLKIGNLGQRQQEHANNAFNLAGAGQNIYNTRNTLDQISQEYQQRMELAQAQAMFDPVAAAALPAIQQLHGISAQGAAQIVGQTFAAAHEHFKQAIAGGLQMMGPSPVMPPALGWGPAPGMPTNMWDHVMQPTAMGGLGSNGSVIDSILGGSPSLLDMGFGLVQGVIDTVHGLASGLTKDVARLFGVDLDQVMGMLPGGMQMPQGWGQLPFNPAMHGLNLFNPNDPMAGLSLLPGQGAMAGQYGPPSYLNAGFPGMTGGMNPNQMMNNFGYGPMGQQMMPGSGMGTPPGMFGNPAAYNPAMLAGHPAMGGMQVPQNMYPAQHWVDPGASPYQAQPEPPRRGFELSGSISLGNILEGLFGISSDPASAPAPIEVSSPEPAPAPAPNPAPEVVEGNTIDEVVAEVPVEAVEGGTPPPAPVDPEAVGTQTTSEAPPERKFGISASLGINTPIGSLNGSFDAYTRLTAFEAPQPLAGAGMGAGMAGAGTATMAPPAPASALGGGGMLGGGMLGGAQVGAPAPAAPLGATAAAAGAAGAVAGATAATTATTSTGGGGGSSTPNTSFGPNQGQTGNQGLSSPLRPGTPGGPVPPAVPTGDDGRGTDRSAFPTNLPEVSDDHNRAEADAFLIASLPDPVSYSARVLARLLQAHDEIGVLTNAAVALMPDGTVIYALSDALGMPPVGMDLPTGTPLLAALFASESDMDASAFVSEWIGADDPASILTLAAAVGFIPEPKAVVTNHLPEGGTVPEGVEFVHPETLARITPAEVDAKALDHLPVAEAEDMDAIMTAMRQEWSVPESGSYTHSELVTLMIGRRWTAGGDNTQAVFATAWWMFAEIEKDINDERAQIMAVQLLNMPLPQRADSE